MTVVDEKIVFDTGRHLSWIWSNLSTSWYKYKSAGRILFNQDKCLLAGLGQTYNGELKTRCCLCLYPDVDLALVEQITDAPAKQHERKRKYQRTNVIAQRLKHRAVNGFVVSFIAGPEEIQ